jgi:pterin-4a-carbinolamine dehydratase
MTIVVMGHHHPASIYATSLLRRSIFSLCHQLNECRHSQRHYSWGNIYGRHDVCVIKIPTMPNTFNSSRCQVLNRRWNHNQIDEQKPEMNSSTQQKQHLPNEKRKVDPFAKRPSQKCDPYGLAGQSLSHKECLDWLVTLECGWKLIDGDTDNNRQENEERDHSDSETPVFLQKQFYHATFHDASRFLSHISLLSTNLNHYPFLSMERVLVDDLSTVSNNTTTQHRNSVEVEQDASKQKRRKVKGWVFVSTVRCSTYRPPTTRADLEKQDNSSQYNDKGLTYHDFHLAMNIDIECNREGCAALLL